MFTVEAPLASPLPTSVRLRARNARTGAIVWTRDLAVDPPNFLLPGTLQPAAAGGKVVMAVLGKLRAFDAASGATAWSLPADAGEASEAVAVDGGLVAWLTAGNGVGEVRFVDLASGRQLSRSAAITAPTGALALRDGVAYVGTDEPQDNTRPGSLIAVARSGKTLWRVLSPYGPVEGIMATGDLIYAGLYYFEGDVYNWNIWALKASSGKQAFFRDDFLRGSWADAVSANLLFTPRRCPRPREWRASADDDVPRPAQCRTI